MLKDVTKFEKKIIQNWHGLVKQIIISINNIVRGGVMWGGVT
jgi:hypothetical protein